MSVELLDLSKAYICLSTDTKPTNPSYDRLYEADTGRWYAWTGLAWVSDASASGSRYSSTTGSFVAAAAGDYADNDVISNSAVNGAGLPITFANAVRVSGGAAKVIGARLTFTAATAIAATTELLLFSQAPTATEMDDNAAAGNVGAADLPYYLGSILFAAGTDIGAATVCLPSALTPAAPLFVRAEATSLFGILVFRDAEANETAAMPVEIVLYVEN